MLRAATARVACALLACSALCSPARAQADFSPLQQAPAEALQLLARLHQPDAEGAIGRNRHGYLHARFQLGLHALADQAWAEGGLRAAEAAVRAAEYGFAHQQADGGFELELPLTMRLRASATEADLASGAAFFLSSAVPAMLALQASPRLAQEAAAARLQQRLAALRVRLPASLGYLQRHEAQLLKADGTAPNRLLFDALAFAALGQALNDEAATRTARRFESAALAQQHAKGYFIEGGGFDSSYNGVACAVGYRLLMLQPADEALHAALRRAIAWQASRVGADGEIDSRGNSRVHPGGERFLGQEKTVDAGHSLEAFALAAAIEHQPAWSDAAHRIATHYAGRR